MWAKLKVEKCIITIVMMIENIIVMIKFNYNFQIQYLAA